MAFQPRGIVVPVITPFRADGSINFPVYQSVIEHLIDNGVHGIFPLGTTGEFYGVSDEEAVELLQATVAVVGGRVPIYAGANHITTRGVKRFIRLCEQVKGIDALSVLTPMFVSQTQDELYTHYKTIAVSTPFPIIMYNNRPKTNVTIEPKTVARLAEIPNIVGVKDSTGDFTNSLEYIRLTKGIPDFHVLLGRDTLIYAGLCHGAAGSIASCANVAPRLVADIFDKYVAGDLAGALEAQMRLNPLRIATNLATFPAIIKTGLELEGFAVGKCLPPIGSVDESVLATVRGVLQNMQLI